MFAIYAKDLRSLNRFNDKMLEKAMKNELIHEMLI